MAAFSRLHHVGIVVANLDASVSWYTEKLGLATLYTFAFPGVKAAMIGRDELRLELLENEAAAPMVDDRRDRAANLRLGGINHVAIRVDRLEEAINALVANGVELASEPMESQNSGGSRFAFIRDNEGMLVELYEAGTAAS